MSRTIAIGKQDFGEVIRENCFYIDKTGFIKEWWEHGDSVTLITRPRRFGKTLTMSMVDYFFSMKHKDDGALFEGLDIWKEEKFRQLQGTYPVIFLSFAKVKDIDYPGMLYSISKIIFEEYSKHRYLLDGDVLSENEKEFFNSVIPGMDAVQMEGTINFLSNFLSRYYDRKVLIFLDEYDTPMQEAYMSGYWDEAAHFFRSLFNATFKTNPYMTRSLIMGITSIGKESMLSDLNLNVITTTSTEYATAMGFTEAEVFAAMDEYGITTKEEMKHWYDGYTFGNVTDIYNPWSVINAIEKKKYAPYWVNTSSNAMTGRLLREADAETKKKLERLIQNKSIECVIDEDIAYNQLDTNGDAIWSLLLASGYLKVVRVFKKGNNPDDIELSGLEDDIYELRLTNLEVEEMLNDMVKSWFDEDKASYNGFLQALLQDDIEYMNEFMNDIALKSFSSFDTAKNASGKDAPERFYHGFVLGLMVELDGRFEIKSNRESGFGRYDVMMIPKDKMEKAFVFEFKVKDADDDETTLEDTLQNAHAQIEEKQYAQDLLASGVPAEHIRTYGFAFEGKTVLIG